MKAIVCPRPGRLDVLRLEEIDRPGLPEDGLLVRVHASSINPADFFQLSRLAAAARRLNRRLNPKLAILGTDFAGTVEVVGKSVTRFKPGDAVFGGAKGAFAEYVAVGEDDGIWRKPANVTFEQAAAVPVAALTALQALRDHGRVEPGQKVLINGASGGVGSYALQLAKLFGAQVTAVCSPRNAETVRSNGADRVIDYTREDFTRSGEQYDLMIDIAGSRRWSECIRVLTPRATFVAAGASSNTVWRSGRTLRHLAGIRLATLGSRRRAAFFIAKLNRADLGFLADLIETGKLVPVLDRLYALNQVPEAMAYMGEGHAKGKIVVTI
jgi:NADPH:quinone reductase-like Zn-dependent oxidoreductase